MSLAAALETLAREAVVQLDADRASVFLLDADNRELWSPIAMGEAELRFDARLGVAGAAALGDKTVNVRNAEEEAGFYPGVDRDTGYSTKTLLATPIKAKDGAVLGVFEALNKKGGVFTDEDAARLEEFAARAAQVVRREQPRSPQGPERPTHRILGTSEQTRAIVMLIEEIRDTAVNVLITGESGTGKELIANAIHQSSDRGDRPFVALNCAALPEELLESELFGIEKGVATGVTERPGRFEQAHGGTLFLDEIADLSLTAQAKILRALQERKIARVGARGAEKPIDVRLIAATNRNLPEEVAAGRFRDDLYFRLKVVHIQTPALREIPGDIAPLAQHFLVAACRDMGRPPKQIAKDALGKLRAYPWPGNIRELENEMTRLAATTRGKSIAVRMLPAAMTSGTPAPAKTLAGEVAELEARLIREALSRTGGNRTEAARRLGLSRQGLLNKIKRYGIG